MLHKIRHMTRGVREHVGHRAHQIPEHIGHKTRPT